MSKMLYCIEHECFELVQNSPVGVLHEYEVSTEFGLELDWCSFDLGWAYCSPPEEYPDWDLDFVEPSEEEEYETIL